MLACDDTNIQRSAGKRGKRVTERVCWRTGRDGTDALVSREWLVTNGLGGYASGTLAGVPTRRYHGLLIAALPNPLGRTMMLNQLSEQISLPDGSRLTIGGFERESALEVRGLDRLREFRLEDGLPVWVFDLGEFKLERRIAFAHLQNTVFVCYRVLEGPGTLSLALRPTFHFRSHDAPVSAPLGGHYAFVAHADHYEVRADPLPPVRLLVHGAEHAFIYRPEREGHVLYRVEAARGYESAGEQWSLGSFELPLSAAAPVSLIASTESWGDLAALTPEQAFAFEAERRRRLLQPAELRDTDEAVQELVFAADQFVISPRGRIVAAMRAHARGDELRSVIAGYHWFTDWGRDTMISLEGLTLCTGRYSEARYILNMFAQYVRDGLIPNLFPEGSHEGLYHTADATLWFFHALDRYVAYTQDRHTLRELLPVLEGIVDRHVAGTHYGIGIDRDGLLRQGQPGYQLTWMDAKCGDWVVTPRRGKAVEINALWYNALRVLERWQREEARPAAHQTGELAERVSQSFNRRFWCERKQYLYDVVDGEGGDDDSLRPNQLFAISLPNPVLARERWEAVVTVVTRELLTPVGLRSLARSHPDYKRNYHGDLMTRDAAYHQGTVWSWLIGPYIDAFRKVEPRSDADVRALLEGLIAHLDDAGVGSISEVFDAEPPFAPRGCIAQAWGVAELLRVGRKM
jgi:predicted glycogen debranching enzyme